MLRCSQGILSSRADHKCDRIADFVMMYPHNNLPRCTEHMVQMLSVSSVAVIVMNVAVWKQWLDKQLEN